MNLSQKMVWNLYSAGVAALAATVTKKAATGAWRFVTGSEPPELNDPETSTGEAVAWAATLALGVGVASVVIHRFAANRWEKYTGQASPMRGVSLRF